MAPTYGLLRSLALLLVLLAAASGPALAECSEEDPDADGDGYCASEDCNDANPGVNPGAVEICDDGRERDDDCDGLIDGADPDCGAPCTEANPDADGDEYCASEDCDDTRRNVHPGAAEACTGGLDEDCDGLVDAADPDCATTGCTEEDPDGDEDGYCASQDCNDANPSINPGAAEVCDDGRERDEDCDGLVDAADPDCSTGGCSEEDPDADEDGYCASQDCNDANPSINPGAAEICDGQGRDEDCDGLADEADPGCSTGGCSDEDPDLDEDGVCASEDCNDENPAVHPGAAEICGGGIDEDCDHLIDAADPDCASSGCTEEDPDADGDGHCASTDCNDEDPSAHPGATEICDEGFDEDCDGLANEEDPDCSGCTEEDPDADGDGHCASTDCNDGDPAVNPDAEELCEGGVDEDCDGRVDQLDPDCGSGGCPDEASGISRWWVYLKDRGLTAEQIPAALLQEEQSLPERTRQRRAARRTAPGIVDDRDLPVALSYVQAIEQTGARVRHESRWLNAVSVLATEDVLGRIRALPFVQRVQPVRGARRDPADALVPGTGTGSPATEMPDHGLAHDQLAMIGVTDLHAAGLTGAGVVIGVLDTGFVTSHTAFQHPERPLRVRAAYDFVDDDPDPGFQVGDFPTQHEHGTIILGTMGAYAPGTYVGGAYDAEFVLAKTENAACEIPAEEDDYVAGLEFAERNGADVVTSSLSYSNWYTQADMDGQTAVTSIAVTLAAINGVHCVTGAGNRGHDADPTTSHLGAPADGFRVVSVGATSLEGGAAGFSSDGPTADGRVKPELMALGVQAWSVHPNLNGAYATFNGTSMSTPQITSALACLVQAHPDWTVDELRTHLMATGSVYRATGTFDPLYVNGFGLPSGLAAEAGDCDASGVRDRIEIEAGLRPDCDRNNVPDACDITFGTWADANQDGVPDICTRVRRPRNGVGSAKVVIKMKPGASSGTELGRLP